MEVFSVEISAERIIHIRDNISVSIVTLQVNK